MSLVEDAFPSQTLYIDAARGEIESKKLSDHVKIDDAWDELLEQLEYVQEHNLNYIDYCRAFQKVEPYCLFPEIVERLQERIDGHE